MMKKEKRLALITAALMLMTPIFAGNLVQAAPQTVQKAGLSAASYRKWLFNADQRRTYDVVARQKTPLYVSSAAAGSYRLKASGKFIKKGQDIGTTGLEKVVTIDGQPYFEIEDQISNDKTYVLASATQGIHFYKSKEYKALVKKFRLDKKGQADQLMVKASKQTKVYELDGSDMLSRGRTLRKGKHYTLVNVELTMHDGHYYLQDDVSAVKADEVKTAAVDETAEDFQ